MSDVQSIPDAQPAGNDPDVLPPEGWSPDPDYLTTVCKQERGAALGLENDSELMEDREIALNYVKGFMPDQPAYEGRSAAMTSDISDAVESILPDLVEIFVGGEDVATFAPRNAKDEDAAQQETDYVHFVVFQQNAGFMTLYSAIKDALINKLGIMKSWTEDCSEDEEMAFQGKTDVELMLAMNDGWEIVEKKPSAFQSFPQSSPAPPPPAGLPPMAMPLPTPPPMGQPA